jgi:hypothetical protein
MSQSWVAKNSNDFSGSATKPAIMAHSGQNQIESIWNVLGYWYYFKDIRDI